MEKKTLSCFDEYNKLVKQYAECQRKLSELESYTRTLTLELACKGLSVIKMQREIDLWTKKATNCEYDKLKTKPGDATMRHNRTKHENEEFRRASFILANLHNDGAKPWLPHRDKKMRMEQ